MLKAQLELEELEATTLLNLAAAGAAMLVSLANPSEKNYEALTMALNSAAPDLIELGQDGYRRLVDRLLIELATAFPHLDVEVLKVSLS